MPPTSAPSPWTNYATRDRDLQGAPPETSALYAAEVARRAVDHLPPQVQQLPIIQETLTFINTVLNPNNHDQLALRRLLNSATTRNHEDQLLNLQNRLMGPQGPTPASNAVRAIREAYNTMRMYGGHTITGGQRTYTQAVGANAVNLAETAAYLVSPGEAPDWHREHTNHQHISGPQDKRFDPRWRTSDVVSLARQIVQTRDIHLLPILADALQDAGCDNEEMLNQLRHESHNSTPASWAVRQILG